MDQIRQHARSTKHKPKESDEPTDNAGTDTGQLVNPDKEERTHQAYLSIQEVPTGRVYTDQTGSFPVVSVHGTKAMMVLYDYDSNAILVEGISSKGKTELVRAYQKLLNRLITGGARPKIQRMDNEVSNIFKQFLQQQHITLELTPAHIHRRNAAERAIRTWKNHFLAGLASLNPKFPLRFWSSLLPQAEMSLNLLRQSRINPKLSAYAQLNGQLDYNRTPMAPPGCEIIAFQPPAQRAAWGYHGQKAWYVRPAMDHYRCIIAINAQTARESVVETVQFLPHNFTMPQTSSQDLAIQAARDLTQALLKPHPAAPFLPPSAQQKDDIHKLAQIFEHMATESHRHDKPPSQHMPATNKTPDRPPPRVQIPTVSQETAEMTTNEGHHSINAVYDPETGSQLEYRKLIRHPKYQKIWSHSAANEFGRLAQGIRNIPGTDTIKFIHKTEVPKGQVVTYGRFVCDIRPQKEEKERTRLTVGGNLIDYPGKVSAPTANLTTYKLHCNDVISTPGAKAVNWDIANFYLNTPLPQPEFMKLHISLIPEEIVQHYNLQDKVDDKGFVYIRIDKGMYGLPQAGALANQLLQQRLAPYGYSPVRHTPGYWRHESKPTAFVLVVDDFSTKYLGQADAEDLIAILKQWYTLKVDWNADLFCGITTHWDYTNKKVRLSMPGYIDDMLRELRHSLPRKPQFSPHPHIPIVYGTTQQMVEVPDNTEPLPLDDPIQPAVIVGKLLYYARAVDSTMLVALSALASEQNKPTMHTKQKVEQLLDYCATQPNATLTFHASDMILKVHSDAGYNNESKARSRAGGHFFLGNKYGKHEIFNGAILNPTHIIQHVASSAAEAEIGAAFINCKEAIPLRLTLTEMGHLLPATPVTIDNTTAVGFANQQIKQRRTKAIDMWYVLLAAGSRSATTVPISMGGGQQKSSGLFHETAPTGTPPSGTATVYKCMCNHCLRLGHARRGACEPARASRPRSLRGCANPGSIQCP
jgi:hypothetical protein